jgi:hypothetical protein
VTHEKRAGFDVPDEGPADPVAERFVDLFAPKTANIVSFEYAHTDTLLFISAEEKGGPVVLSRD